MDFTLNALGFVVLVSLFLWLRSVVRGRRRRAAERLYRSLAARNAGPTAGGETRCPRCAAAVPAGAAYCPRCGAAVPPPLYPAVPPRLPERSRSAAGCVYAIFVMLGLVGLAVYWFTVRPAAKPAGRDAPPWVRPPRDDPNRW